MPGLGERMSKVEGILEQMSERLNHIETRMDHIESRMAAEFTAIRAEMGSIRAEMNSMRAEMASHFRWTLAFVMGMWVTVIVAVLFK